MSTDRVRREFALARSWLGALSPSDVRPLLGADHPLTRSTELVHTVAVQAITTVGTGVVGAVAIAARLSWRATVVRVAMIVELVLIVVLLITLQLRRADVLRVIAGGEEHLPLEEVAREARHLASRGHLSALAGRLELGLKHAREWDQAAGGARPREGVVLLRSFGPEVDQIVGLLRTPAPAPRGVAVLELLLIRVYGSTLYVGEIELERELWRTRFLLKRGWASEEPDLSVSPTAE